MFDVSLPITDELVPFVKWIASLPPDRRPKTAAYPMAQDPFADPPVLLAQTLLSKLGVRTVYSNIFPEEVPAYKAPADQVASTGADLVVLGSTDVPTVSAFMQEFEQQHYTPKLFIAASGPDQGTSFTSAVGVGNADGMMVPNGWYPGYANASSQNMVKEYVAENGGSPSGVNADVAEAYSVGQVMAQAVTATGGTDNAKIISYLHSDVTLTSVQGPVKFDALGENGAAAAFVFPRDTQVRVSAQELSSGGLLIEVSDSGVGISEARLAEMNLRLINSPVIDVSVSRHMGLFAVARLAERHGVRVRLRAGSPQGLTVLVWLPDSLTERGTRPYGGWSQPPLLRAVQADFQARRTIGRHGIGVRSAPDGQPANNRADAATADAPVGAGPGETAQAAVPATSAWFRSRRLSATPAARNGGSPPWAAPQAGNGGLSGPDGWTEGRHAAQIIADPVRGDDTVAGLPVRVPRANLIPGSAGGYRADSRVTSRQADGHEAQTPAGLRPQRSPEMARSRLSGFQRGARRAEGQTPRTAEGADR